MHSRERKDWEPGGDSEGLGRLERPRRPGEEWRRVGAGRRNEWETA